MYNRISVTFDQKVRSCGNNCPPKIMYHLKKSAIHTRYWVWQIKYQDDSGGLSWKQ